MTETLCTHCSLPTSGVLELERSLDGEECTFCCYGCCIAYQMTLGKSDEPQAAWLLIRLGIGAFLSMNIMLFSLLLYSEVFNPLDVEIVRGVHILLWVLATPVLIILGGPFMQNAWQTARHGRASADTLIVLGVCSAYGYSVASILHGGQAVYFDTVTMVLILFTVGRYLEASGRARCSRSLEPMLNNAKTKATIWVDGQTQQVLVNDLSPGMTLLVAAGERIAADGVVLEGDSQVDESMLTGESRAVEKKVASEVLAGTLNGEGQLLINCTVTGSLTRWASICHSVRESLMRKSHWQKIADQVAGYFVPAVLLLAVATVMYHAETGVFSEALLAGVAVLVVACPCALGLATPLATSLGISGAAQRGCLIRGGDVFEALASIRAVAFDKTGTLTSGDTQLVQIISEEITESELLAHAAAIEQACTHPMAQGILVAASDKAESSLVATDIQERPGLGVEGVIAGVVHAVGHSRFMEKMGWTLSDDLQQRLDTIENDGHTHVYVGWDGKVRGVLVLQDELSAQAQSMVTQIQHLGMATCVLSGDRLNVVQRVSLAAGIADFQADLSPEDKLKAMLAWREDKGNTAMVGDGLNDGPVLSAATVGVAVGDATDLVREVADVVLPRGGLDQLPWLFSFAHRVQQVIVSNLYWAFGYNIVALSLAAAGLLQPMWAAALMAGSSVIVVLNSLRLNSSDQSS